MRDLHIGDRVTFSRRAYFVRGFSPMSITRPTIHLEDAQTGEQLEVALDELIAGMPPASGHPSSSNDVTG
jgi:hypothetical protein